VGLRSFSHIGIAVTAIESGLRLYRDVLGLELEGTEEVSEQKVRVAMLRAGTTRVELLEPLSDESAVAKFIAKRGPGIHHIALEVEDIDRTLETLVADGLEVVGGGPKPGAGGARAAFLHPKGTGGVLIELCARKARSRITP
jgi:methylmalonyl-CoA/ethylmalonyl-CoA epimerase